MDVSKGMEIDDHPSFLPKSDKGSDGPPQTSYARVVSGSGRQVVNDPVPSLDDVVVEAGNVLVDTTSTFPSVSFSDKVHERIDHSMHHSLIIRLLGYKTLIGRIRVLWQPQGDFQVVE
ncbi:hypothetical protein V6N12_069048 [Hibiscus sabdariffa]|uniref:Uncharacterized protein n=1 Tax=Hibiscus sabdariffa TaxID=183260 RepID=A0ABR2FCS6_9ROSI